MKPEQQIEELVNLSRVKIGSEVSRRIALAASMAMEFHRGQTRKVDGGPYVSHCLSVAYNILSWGLNDEVAVCAALLHDAMEDAPPEVNASERIEQFNPDVLRLVQALSKIRNLQTGAGDLPATYRRILQAASKDLRVLIIKTFDVYHNAETLYVHGPDKAKNKASLSLIYVGVARRLGMITLADAIIDRILPFLMPVQNQQARKILDTLLLKGRASMDQLSRHLRQVLGDHLALDFTIEGKTLSDFFCLAEKPGSGRLMRVGWPVYRIRLLVEDDDAAWRVLGKMHALFGPLPRHVRDYMNAPRVNGFRALTSRILWEGNPINVQVVRKYDDRANRMGVLAEWGVSGPDPAKYMRLLATLGDSDLRMSEVHAHVLPDLLDVYTPKGDRHTFPVGAVVLDFAYMIHTDLGHRCIGAKVNEIPRPADYPLHDGDVVRILTAKNGWPQRSWLHCVKTARASTLIKQALKSGRSTLKGINRSPTGSFQLTSLTGEDIRWSTCCLAVPRVPIVGRLSEDGLWIVHRQNCSRIHPDEWERGHWDLGNTQVTLHVSFNVQHQSGALLLVLELLARYEINGKSISGKTRPGGLYTIGMEMGGQGVEVLGQVLLELPQLPSVREILKYRWQ
ncbi:MAG: bifunctional (p)ppGpp synthetase/guanosine-3',5'-bis(diphosphate) 3'-pyrophosphohydrolase [Magnetococcales bacterium]|nr:bifunctional (p)ppGpp synthetase/guanosine-3',5'-bis(diphosphate) 3'-pyrophosphohydrolase [Magnetococcales bacterium]MBF0152030.1 bifunctional (p)ppGpp synthetase/guanosine-3',5'-bis(diphosphate) 3'-pyrophosphohydrolase [Magnetococcales bacterium]MBF0349083.1 bifunctional (p)ppGpp synthetase/guanosine-3',5'-bis(diphosphate) 3'-pyrophosphohydrolase [Magnetococcales bacterium]